MSLSRFSNSTHSTRRFIDLHPNYEALQGYTILEGTATERLAPLVENLIDNSV